MSFQDDVAAIAAEHGPHVAIEYAAQCHEALYEGFAPGMGKWCGDQLRSIWADFWKSLLLNGLRIAASSGAAHELDYYATEVTP